MEPINITNIKRNDSAAGSYALRNRKVELKTIIETFYPGGVLLLERQELTTAEAIKTQMRIRGAKKQRAAKAVAPSSIKKIEVKKYNVVSMVQTLAESKIRDNVRVRELEYAIQLVEVVK